MIREVSKIKYVYELLTPRIRGAIMSMPEIKRDRIQEIRLRRGRRLSVTIFSKEYFVNDNGRLMNNIGDSVQVTTDDIETIYQRAFQNSLHSFHREIARGYITVSGGCRVGFCGTAVLDPARSYAVESVKNISSLNIRIAREMIGSSDEIYAKCFSDKPMSLLIASPPSGGKTTVLRDLSRKLGERWRVALIDERNEFAATVAGEPQNLIGAMTDVFNSYNKYEGIMTAVKVMSPQILICDEIGSSEDNEALQYALNSGVKLIASCHASSLDELKKRRYISKLIKDKTFDALAVLGTGTMCGRLVSFTKTGA